MKRQDKKLRRHYIEDNEDIVVNNNNNFYYYYYWYFYFIIIILLLKLNICGKTNLLVVNECIVPMTGCAFQEENFSIHCPKHKVGDLSFGTI